MVGGWGGQPNIGLTQRGGWGQPYPVSHPPNHHNEKWQKKIFGTFGAKTHQPQKWLAQKEGGGGFQPNQPPKIASQPPLPHVLLGLATPKNALAYASICDPESDAKDTKQYHGQGKEAVAHMDE